MAVSRSQRSPSSDDHALALEEIGHAAVGAQVAVVLGEDVPHLGGGAVLVVGLAFDQDGHAAGPVALVVDLFDDHAVQFAGAALDGLRRWCRWACSRRARSVTADRRRGLASDVTAALAGGDGDFTDQPGEDLGPLGVLRALAVLDVRPFGMSCHATSLFLGGLGLLVLVDQPLLDVARNLGVVREFHGEGARALGERTQGGGVLIEFVLGDVAR